MIRSADWYFDFVSPYSYLQFKHFHRLPASLEINLVPILFAGLLNHWGHKGPAEIPSKRVEMYRYCHWYASRLGVPFRTPPAHPFNPLKVLRLAMALNSDHKTVETIFDHIWGQGHDIHSEDGFASLVDRLNVADVDQKISSAGVKQALRDNTEQAVALGIYGTPTFVIDDVLFWGFDRMEMLLEYLDDPGLFETEEMDRLADIPMAAERRR